jgi:hypothetical protein
VRIAQTDRLAPHRLAELIALCQTAFEEPFARLGAPW